MFSAISKMQVYSAVTAVQDLCLYVTTNPLY